MDNSWIVVTSPGGGIGQTLTPHLLERGYSVIGMGSEHSKKFVDSLQSDNIRFVEVEYTSEKSIEKAFDRARSFCDRIEGLVHLTGGSLITRLIADLSLDEFQQVIQLNLDSTFLVGREAIRWMNQTGGGNIIFFGSTTGIEPSAGKMAYGVAKAAVHNMTLSFALEASKHNIFCNTIAPSYVMTTRHKRDIVDKSDRIGVDQRTIKAELASKNPLNKILDPSDLLPAVDLLLSTKSIQGQVIRVDLGQVGI